MMDHVNLKIQDVSRLPNEELSISFEKDFWQMFVHHIVTLCLMVFSWACQLHRIGTLVLVIHDFADIPLEGAKMAKYVKRQRLADLIFVVFAIAWIWSRCGLYPYRVIYYSSYVALFLVPMFPAYYIFNGLLCTLQLLHIMWTILILNIAIHALKNDGVSIPSTILFQGPLKLIASLHRGETKPSQ